MKKIFIIISAFLILSSSLSAMEQISDDFLDDVTGKAGISCYIANNPQSQDKIQMGLYFGKLVWGDEEGGNDGYIMMYGAENVGDTTVAQSGVEWDVESSLLTFDVYTDNGGTTKLKIGLPILTSKPALSNYYYFNLTDSAATSGTNLGVLYTKEIEITVPGMPSAIEIWGH